MDSNVTISIGEACLDIPAFQPGLRLEAVPYTVELFNDVDPEEFPVPEMPNAKYWIQGNVCILPYSHWVSMAKNHGAIHEALLRKDFGLMRDRGIFGIGRAHIELIKEALEFYEKENLSRPVRLLPGFEGRSVYDVPSQKVIREDVGIYDTTLASLIWLYNWMEYGEANSAENPAVEVR